VYILSCPKKMINGPCGGYNRSRCEDPRLECVWIKAFENLKKYGKEKDLFKLKLDSMFKIRDHKPIKRDIREKLKIKDRIYLIYEYVASRDIDPRKLEKDLDHIFSTYDAIDFVQNPGGRPLPDPLSLAVFTKKIYPHKHVGFQITGRDYDRDAITSIVASAVVFNIDSIIATTGDLKFHKEKTYGVWDLDSPRIIYLIRLISDLGRDYSGRKILEKPREILVGASLNPYLDPIEPEIYKLNIKKHAGADFFVTQPIFEPETYTRIMRLYKDLLNENDIPEIIPGISIISDIRIASFLIERSGVKLPSKILEVLKREDFSLIKETNIEFISDLVRKICVNHEKKIFYISTFGDIDMALEIGESIKKMNC